MFLKNILAPIIFENPIHHKKLKRLTIDLEIVPSNKNPYVREDLYKCTEEKHLCQK